MLHLIKHYADNFKLLFLLDLAEILIESWIRDEIQYQLVTAGIFIPEFS